MKKILVSGFIDFHLGQNLHHKNQSYVINNLKDYYVKNYDFIDFA